MTSADLIVLTALLATGPLSPADPGQAEVSLGFAPAPGTTRSIEVSLLSGVDGGLLEVVMNGDPVPETFLPELTLVYEDERSFTALEVFLAGGDEGPSEWLRHYADIGHTNLGSFTMTMGGQEPMEMPWETDAESELTGTVLHITDEDGALSHQVVEGEAPPEDLRLDLSFASLLPADPVPVGESWQVEDEALAFLLEPGGDLGIVLSAEERQNLMPDYETREHAGQLTLTLVTLAEGLARVELEGQLERISVGPGDLSMVPVADGEATDTTTETYQVAGELIWDTGAGALAELSIAGRLELATVTLRDPDLEGPTYESTFSNQGEWSLEVRCEPAESRVLEAAAAR